MRIVTTALILVCATTAWADTTRRHSVIFSGKVGGAQTTTVRNDGRIIVDLSYRNNGRGPDLREETVLAADGTQISYRAVGKSTYGAPIDETFQRSDQRCSWQTLADRGDIVLNSPAVYVPVSTLAESTPETLAIIARTVVRQTGGVLAALPSGELRIEKLRTATITSPEGPTGLSLYSLVGLTTQPMFIWLTSDDSRRLFAFIEPGWMQIIEAGSESQADSLEQLQLDSENELIAALAKRLTHHLPEPIVFRNVKVLDTTSGRLSEPSDLYVVRGRIASVYPAGSTMREAGTVIEGCGRVLMPALFDMHSHEDSWNCLLQIAGGVTTSRDMGNDIGCMAELKTRIDSGATIGPRIVPCGFIEGDSPFSARLGFVVDDLQKAIDAVDWYAQHGYRQIKLYNSFNPEWAAPTAKYAHACGLRVSGHVPAFMKAAEAVRAGYDELQHVNQAMLGFFVGPEDDTRTLARFYLIAENAHRLELDSAAVQDFITLLKEHGTTLDTTLTCFEPSFTQMQGEPNPAYQVVEDHVPVGLRRQRRTNSMDVTKENVETYRASYAKMLEFVGRLHRAGVPLVAGTDDIAGFTLYRELELYVKAGIPAADALRIATWSGAKFTGTLDSLGSVERGKLADLILVDGDPTTDISDIRRVSLVMKEGTVFYPAEVYESMGVKRFVDPPKVTAAP